MQTIYGPYEPYLHQILAEILGRIESENKRVKAATGFKLYEHLLGRIKDADSMAEKCRRKNLPANPQSALRAIRDSIGIRLVCGFVDDIYQIVALLRSFPDCQLVEEKDYIAKSKPNGYRSYHLILEITTDFPDCQGNEKGKYFVEIQLRTIAQDSWASLEHQLKYKQNITNTERIERELKRCADELASCDLSMQTIRQLIQTSSALTTAEEEEK